MKVFLKRAKTGINAKAEFNPDTKGITVLKGSILSEAVSHTGKFRGARSIEKIVMV